MNVPKLRFKEFNDEWQNYKVEEILKISNGINKEKEFFGSGTPIINYMDVNKNELISHNIVKGLVTANSKELETFNVKKGDILFTRTSETSDEIGLSSSVIENIDKCIFSGFILKGTQTKQFIHPYFGGYYFRNPKMRKEIIKHSSITTRALTSGSLLSQMSISIPTIIEQEKIGKTLSLLDKKIELQAKKIEDLKLFKKGLLIKEFNNKKSSNKLKECFDFGKAGGTPKSTNKDYYNGYIPFLTISDMTTQGKYIYYTDKSITEAGLNNSTAWLVPKNSIIISMYASYGLVSINKIDLTTSQAMFNMVINKNYVVEYIYYYLYYLYISNFYNSIVSTGTQSNLNAEQIKLLDIYIPCYNEQKRIYEQFSKIDFKINLEQKKINELLYLKKGLMQNMFV